jgi:3,4-dihydroxy 2-butanone 4-phosphate synthase / GTP cyclohydrolase II
MVYEIEARRNHEPPSLSPNTDRLSFFREQWHKSELGEQMTRWLLEKGEPLVERLSVAPLPTQYGDWTHVLYGDKTTGKIHEVVVYGDLREALGDGEQILTRIHSSHKPNELWSAHTSDDREQLNESMARIQEAGRGVIVYLNQEGRGHGEISQHKQFNNMFTWENKKIVHRADVHITRAYEQAGLDYDARTFNQASEILTDLGVKSIILLTNNPSKIAGLVNAGIQVVDHTSLHISTNNSITRGYQLDQQANGYHRPPKVVFTNTGTR